MADEDDDGILAKLDSVAPMQKFDAFPKLPATYKAQSSGGGLWTILILLVSLLLVMNDVHEYIWGWPDQEFSVDTELAKTMVLNVDMVVAMPCGFLSVDLRDTVGERLHLSNGFRRDGTTFDPMQARALKTWNNRRQFEATEIYSQSRRSRGLFAWFKNPMGGGDKYPPTYNYRPDASACRIYGSVEVKKVTANLHITTLGHGYASHEHTDHSKMNLSHVITEFSFGPYIPNIVQPLDYSFEITHKPFSIFQYFITVVPTTYYASPSRSVRTNQYSVTHYVKHIEHGQGAPGIFYRFDIDPMAVEVHQRSTLFHDFFIRVAGVLGGMWVCAGWAFKVGGKAAEVVTGKKGGDDELLVQEARSSGRKSRWTGGSLNKRSSTQRLGGGWDGDSMSVASPSWSPNPSLASPSIYSPNPYTPSASLSTSLNGGPPPSPYPTGTRTPSGGSQWGGASLAPPSPFPASPFPPLSPSPYSPAPQSATGGGFAASQAAVLTPTSPAPPSSNGGPYTPGGHARRPSMGPGYAPSLRSSSSLNPNSAAGRTISNGSGNGNGSSNGHGPVVDTAKKDD